MTRDTPHRLLASPPAELGGPKSRPGTPDRWAAPEMVAVERLRHALAWLRDPDHPVQRLVANADGRPEAANPTWRADVDRRLLEWLRRDDVYAHFRDDPAAAAEEYLLARRRAEAGVYW